VVLLIKGGDEVGPNLSLLGQYFIGYRVSWVGSVVGLLYGFISGFILGWLAAFLRNLVLDIYLRIIKLRTNLSSAQDLFD
jgi:ABC-type dipeptide/oligopeptide/nickel transport system permease subunit